MVLKNIKKYLQIAYSDEKLAALLAHAQDGKLGYFSCCCFVGAANATHPLKEAVSEEEYPSVFGLRSENHVNAMRYSSKYAGCAELEFYHLAKNDDNRRERIIPIILEEIARRDALKAGTMEDTSEEPTVEEEWDDGKTMIEMVHSIGVPK